MPSNELERIHTLETGVAVLSKDSSIQTKSLEKMEDVIDRAETHIEALNRNIIIYEDRLRTQEKINMNVEQSLKDINQKLDNFMVEIEEKIDNQDEKRREFLEELKRDLISEIQASAPKPEIVDPKDDGKFKVFKFLVDNWKYIAFATAILGGLMFHKWGLLTSLLGITANG